MVKLSSVPCTRVNVLHSSTFFTVEQMLDSNNNPGTRCFPLEPRAEHENAQPHALVQLARHALRVQLSTGAGAGAGVSDFACVCVRVEVDGVAWNVPSDEGGGRLLEWMLRVHEAPLQAPAAIGGVGFGGSREVQLMEPAARIGRGILRNCTVDVPASLCSWGSKVVLVEGRVK